MRELVEPTIQALIGPLVERATNDAVDQLRKALPSRGFERMLLNRRWVTGE